MPISRKLLNLLKFNSSFVRNPPKEWQQAWCGHYSQAESYFSAGLNPVLSKSLFDYNIPAKDALEWVGKWKSYKEPCIEWQRMAFGCAEALYLTRIGWPNAEVARYWLIKCNKWKASPSEALATLKKGFLNPEVAYVWHTNELIIEIKNAADWANAGFATPEAAYNYYKKGLSPSDSKDWQNDFETAEQYVSIWKANMGEPETALEWKNAGWSNPREAAIWHKNGWSKIPPNVSLKWKNSGWTFPTIAYEFFELECQPEESRAWLTDWDNNARDVEKWKRINLPGLTAAKAFSLHKAGISIENIDHNAFNNWANVEPATHARGKSGWGAFPKEAIDSFKSNLDSGIALLETIKQKYGSY